MDELAKVADARSGVTRIRGRGILRNPQLWRSMRRLALLTAGWTAFQWWAVIGWPATAETSLGTLLVVSVASVLSLTAWHTWGAIAARRLPTLVIVARDRPDLHARLVQRYARRARVRVFVDRRRETSANGARAARPGPRERRAAPPGWWRPTPLATRGYQIVRLSPS
jgi:hypothetical protein